MIGELTPGEGVKGENKGLLVSDPWFRKTQTWLVIKAYLLLYEKVSPRTSLVIVILFLGGRWQSHGSSPRDLGFCSA